jgi:serine/threonine-protein kinase
MGTENLYSELGPSFALSRDGRTLAFVEVSGSERKLFVRSLDRLTSDALGVEGSSMAPYHPFLSPRGDWIGYATTGELRKVQTNGGAPITICQVARSRGAAWLADDTIVFTKDPASGLSRVPAAGGEPQALTQLGEEESTHRWPQALPDGKHVLFTSNGTQPTYDNASLEVVAVDSGERKVVYRGGTFGRFVPSGHLVFLNHGTLFAIRFDLESLTTSGAPVPVLQKIASSPSEGGAQFDFSDTGRLIYSAQTEVTTAYPIDWVGRDGTVSTLYAEPGLYTNPRLSPDGNRLALTVLRNGNWDVWVHDVARGVSTRLTFDDGVESEQVWSPDGEFLIFSSDRAGPDALYRKRADGSGELERLTEPRLAQWASGWSKDGRYVAFMENKGTYDLSVLDLETREAKSLLDTRFGEGFAEFSPNGRFLAYASNESGQYQVYVRPFPSGEGKWQVSDSSGTTPRWRADGRELFWRDDDGIVAAAVETDGASFRAGKPERLVSGAWRGGLNGIGASGLSFADFDVTADGQRFVMFPDVAEKTQGGVRQHLTLVTRWFDQLASIDTKASQ